jgi:hypothetical protein
MAAIVSIHLAGRLALLDSGETVPITTLLDMAGDETTDETEAVAFVCGVGRHWFCDALDGYDRATVQ